MTIIPLLRQKKRNNNFNKRELSPHLSVTKQHELV